MKPTWLTNASWVAFATAILSLVALGAYTLSNESGHSGFAPYWCIAVFIPAALVGTINLVSSKPQATPWIPGIAALLAGIIGSAYLVYLDASNTLLPYQVWIERGMP